jgi:hypothetical protein
MHLTLTDVLANPHTTGARLTLRALADVLRRYGYDLDNDLEAWQAQHEADHEAFRDSAQLWTIYSDSDARRRDGVVVRSGRPSHMLVAQPDATEGRPWHVEFPGSPGGPALYDVLHGPTLADVVQLVDERWPCPDWWLSIDRRLLR